MPITCSVKPAGSFAAGAAFRDAVATRGFFAGEPFLPPVGLGRRRLTLAGRACGGGLAGRGNRTRFLYRRRLDRRLVLCHSRFRRGLHRPRGRGLGQGQQGRQCLTDRQDALRDRGQLLLEFLLKLLQARKLFLECRGRGVDALDGRKGSRHEQLLGSGGPEA